MEDWCSLWGTIDGIFNCSTATFDVGSLKGHEIKDVRVACYRDGPVLTEKPVRFSCNPPYPSGMQWGGAWVQILEIICKNLNVRCKLFEVKQPNVTGSESAALHTLLEGSADISLSMLLATPARLLNLTAIPSPEHLKYSLLVHKRFLTQKGPLTDGIISDAFQPLAWACFGLMFLLLLCVMVLSAKLRTLIYKRESSWKRTLLDISLGQITSSFTDYDISIFQTLPSTITLTSLCLIGSVIFSNAFYAIIPSQLTVERLTIAPFSTIDELLLSDFKIYSSGAILQLMLTSKSKDKRQLGTRIIAQNFDNSFYQHMAGGNTSKEAYLLPTANYDLIASYTCDYVVAIPSMHTAPRAAYWFRSDSNLRSNFSRMYFSLWQSGMIPDILMYFDRVYDQLTFLHPSNKAPDCVLHVLSTKQKVSKRAVRFSDLSLPFYMGFAIIFGIGSLLLALELCCTWDSCGIIKLRKNVV